MGGYEYHTNLRTPDFTDIEVDHIKAVALRMEKDVADTLTKWGYHPNRSGVDFNCCVPNTYHYDGCWERFEERMDRAEAKIVRYKKRYPSIFKDVA